MPNRPLSLRSLPASAYVFFAVFVLRLIVLVRLTEAPLLLPTQGDMHFYNDWAQRILRGELTDHRAFYGLPLYAYLLAGLYKLLGFSPFIPGLLQAALEGGTAVILVKTGRKVFRAADADESNGGELSRPFARRGWVIGLLAALGWAFYLPAQAYSVILMPTAWLVFIFWWIVWQILRHTAMPRPLWFFGIGLLIGATAMGIATVLFLVPLLVAASLWRWRSEATSAVRLRSVAVAGLLLFGGLGIGTSPAWLHNYFVAHDSVFLSAHSGVNLWIGNNPDANGYPRFPPGLRAGQQAMLQDSIRGAEAAAGRPLKRSEVSAFWSAKAKAYLSENPGAAARLAATKIANFWNSFQYDDISVITSLREQGVVFPGIRFGFVAALGLAGIVLAVRSLPLSRWVLAAVLLHMLSLLSVFITERYRLAAVPGLLLFAAFAVTQLWEACATGAVFRAATVIGLLGAASIAVSMRRGDPELWALDPYNSGLHALEANQLAAAEKKLRLAHAYVPGNAEVNFALGNFEIARGKRESAKEWYGKTLELNPYHEGVFNNLGVLALEEERWDVAADAFRKALAQDPQDAKTHYLLAKALLGTGDVNGASREITTAVALDSRPREFLDLQTEIQGRSAESPAP